MNWLNKKPTALSTDNEVVEDMSHYRKILVEQIKININNILEKEGGNKSRLELIHKNFDNTAYNVRIIDEQLLRVIASNENMTGSVVDALGEVESKISISKNKIEEAIIQTDQILNVFEQIMEVSNIIKMQFEDIAKFAQRINKIAIDTGLLSFNAAIIAAKADGESQTFGVVAKEMKNISDITQERAKNIIKVVEDMSETMHTLDEKYQSGKLVVNKSVNQMKSISETMQELENTKYLINYEILEAAKVQNNNKENILKITTYLEDIIADVDNNNELLEKLLGSVGEKSSDVIDVLNQLTQIEMLDAK
ncbi:hypothetical protein AN639_00650 [Candidatus Epulonipiscium fishelsonii]|uniref:Uncharacterized protein n=1 Tax=Candidatus Epulonipiscium fishelsonii TaxID=77094 RepID=A0ACC8X7R4_9FIRM|nr:hypothetical protein AN396_12505 [Epulopiscium sp. SCG-B11WGA-EpuloA1]ONI41309.1 hypothetical protein AN639_00650 [Epulopiscium sp. SCG-B05WGA-EpuloA1]